MHSLLSTPPQSARREQTSSLPHARDIYDTLGAPANAPMARATARHYLQQQLLAAEELPDGLPERPEDLLNWARSSAEQVGVQYQAYLAERKHGAPRRYFTSKSHALYFLRAAAPTKLVDGSWLYSALQQWQHQRFRALIQIYLEELGDGVEEKNHVVLYQKLLASHGCDDWQDLDERYFVQGAIQLSLAHDNGNSLPEIIGFNLGYEQLPLHLLITTYELNELGIDPYYFTLHVTVDNGSTGHARKATDAVLQLMPRFGDAQAFYRRVRNGFRLNDLGAGTTDIIAGFDLRQELIRILCEKSVAGKNMHSDYCRIGGKSINDWLADKNQVPALLEQLTATGWIQRGAPVENSRFWRLIQSERAEMFGVFSPYEQQVLRDWIESPLDDTGIAAPRIMSHRAAMRSLDTLAQAQPRPSHSGARGVFRRHMGLPQAQEQHIDMELRALEQAVAEQGSKGSAMDILIPLMSPAYHHSAAGLMATRLYKQLLA
ncbi:iron-containing redox enzyme family protein [Janthinobacterium sp. RB2R34]|uniref:iron-containing redox enzyme family protein n=1 Tax=Janthinobacterium sp. RB2R34 TaxID=3424193 RepID=UPI003F2934C8